MSRRERLKRISRRERLKRMSRRERLRRISRGDAVLNEIRLKYGSKQTRTLK